MADLIQFQEHGFQTPAGVDWYRGSACIVTGANRRRILDRDSIEPRDDGWAYETRNIGDDTDACTTVSRIRWDDTRLNTQADIDRQCAEVEWWSAGWDAWVAGCSSAGW